MPRYIDADALEKEGWSLHRDIQVDKNTWEYQTKPLRQVPTIEPRKKGKWIYLDKDKRFFHPHIVKCSVCNNTLDMYGVNAGRGDANFCPNCGADMTEGEG